MLRLLIITPSRNHVINRNLKEAILMNLEQPKGLLTALLIFIVVILNGCAKNNNIISEKLIPTTASNMVEDKNPIEGTEIEDFDQFGITIQLPKNENWIENPTYSIIDETVAQVDYYDKLVKTDITLRVGKMNIETLSGIRYSFDDKLEENWFARTEDGKNINIKVQYAISDKALKVVLVSWNYKEFNYTLWGNISTEGVDPSPIAKTAVYIANKMR
jgi:hypothetical protein